MTVNSNPTRRPPVNWTLIAVVLILCAFAGWQWWQERHGQGVNVAANGEATLPAGEEPDLSTGSHGHTASQSTSESSSPRSSDRVGQRPQRRERSPGSNRTKDDRREVAATESATTASATTGASPSANPESTEGPSPSGSRPKPRGPPQSAGEGATDSAGDTSDKEATPPDAALVIKNAVIRDERNQVVYRGDIDLGPTLARIRAGEHFPHRNDGAVFQNREGRLPRKPSGYYKEYVHPTPRLSGPGPQRIILGSGGEIYYTGNHYTSFTRLK